VPEGTSKSHDVEMKQPEKLEKEKEKEKEEDRPSKRKRESKFDIAAVQNTLNSLSTIQKDLASSIGTSFDVNEAARIAAASVTSMSSSSIGSNPLLAQQTRPSRRVYLGNLPIGVGLTGELLQEYINMACTYVGISTPNPILSHWMSQDSNFAFIEMKGVEDATVLTTLLQGIQINARMLKVARPADYKPCPLHLANFIVGHNPGEFASPSVVNAPKCTLNMNVIGGKASITSQVPQAVLVFEHLVQKHELTDDELFLDIIDDVREECGKFGNVLQVIIPRPTSPSGTAKEELDPQTGVVKGMKDIGPWSANVTSAVGKVFVHFETETAATNAKHALNGRYYNYHQVSSHFFPLWCYNLGMYSL
jgi:hypothetical protein